jgi:hypothetical protein
VGAPAKAIRHCGAGYGAAEGGRKPGLWDLSINTFTSVETLKDLDIPETSSFVPLPPAQDKKVMVLGSGGVGESRAATSRTAIADLDAARPAFTPAPSLPENTRSTSASLTARMPDGLSLMPSGRHLAFATDHKGVPLKTVWLHARPTA